MYVLWMLCAALAAVNGSSAFYISPKPNVETICVGKPNFLRIPSSDDCIFYHQCYAGRTYLMRCPDHTWFNEDIQVCDYSPAPQHCNGEHETDEEIDEGHPEEEGNGEGQPDGEENGEEHPEEEVSNEEHPEEEGNGEGQPEEEDNGEGHPEEEVSNEEHPEEEGNGEGQPQEEDNGEGHPEEEVSNEEHPEEEGNGEGQPEEEDNGEGHPEEEVSNEEHPEEEGNGEDQPEEEEIDEGHPEEAGNGEDHPEEEENIDPSPENENDASNGNEHDPFTTERDIDFDNNDAAQYGDNISEQLVEDDLQEYINANGQVLLDTDIVKKTRSIESVNLNKHYNNEDNDKTQEEASDQEEDGTTEVIDHEKDQIPDVQVEAMTRFMSVLFKTI